MMKKLLALVLTIVCFGTTALSAAGCAEQKMPSFSINEAGELICTLPDGSTQNLGKVRGRDGEDGQDGQDGLDGKDGQNGMNGKDGINGQDGKDGAYGQNGKDGEDGKGGSVITIGDNGYWYIDGEDTFIIAGKRDAIEVDMTGEAFGPEIPLPVQFRSVPQTDHELNLDYVNIRYDDNGEIYAVSLQTEDVKDVYILYDMICRDFDPDMNGLLLLPDTRQLSSIHTVYTATYFPPTASDLNASLFLQYKLFGYIRIQETEYPFEIIMRPCSIDDELCGITNRNGPSDTFARYICADGDKILTQPSQFMISRDMGGVGAHHGAYRPAGIYYTKTEGNPYTGDMQNLASWFMIKNNYFFLNWDILIYDDYILPDETIDRAVRSIVETLRDSFVVYDYDHYRHQFDHE